MDPPLDLIATADRIIENIRPQLAGAGAPVQGLVLAELLAMYIAGHHPSLRDDILRMHVDCVRRLIPHNEPPGGHYRH